MYLKRIQDPSLSLGHQPSSTLEFGLGHNSWCCREPWMIDLFSIGKLWKFNNNIYISTTYSRKSYIPTHVTVSLYLSEQVWQPSCENTLKYKGEAMVPEMPNSDQDTGACLTIVPLLISARACRSGRSGHLQTMPPNSA